jgi:hypothetical protein
MLPAVTVTTRTAAPRSAKDELAELRLRVVRAEARLEALQAAQLARIPLDGRDFLTARAHLRNAIRDAENSYDFARAGHAQRELVAVEREFARRKNLDLSPTQEPLVLAVDETTGDMLVEFVEHRSGHRHSERRWLRADGEPLSRADVVARQGAWWRRKFAGDTPTAPYPQLADRGF